MGLHLHARRLDVQGRISALVIAYEEAETGNAT